MTRFKNLITAAGMACALTITTVPAVQAQDLSASGSSTGAGTAAATDGAAAQAQKTTKGEFVFEPATALGATFKSGGAGFAATAAAQAAVEALKFIQGFEVPTSGILPTFTYKSSTGQPMNCVLTYGSVPKVREYYNIYLNDPAPTRAGVRAAEAALDAKQTPVIPSINLPLVGKIDLNVLFGLTQLAGFTTVWSKDLVRSPMAFNGSNFESYRAIPLTSQNINPVAVLQRCDPTSGSGQSTLTYAVFDKNTGQRLDLDSPTLPGQIGSLSPDAINGSMESLAKGKLDTGILQGGKDGSSSPAGIIGILLAIIALIGGIAAAMSPQVQQFLGR